MYLNISCGHTINAYRFGKTLWYRLPEDVLASDKGWSVKTFAEFVCSDTNHSQIFDTE